MIWFHLLIVLAFIVLGARFWGIGIGVYGNDYYTARVSSKFSGDYHFG